MKKLLLSLGAIAATIAPIASLVACGSSPTSSKTTNNKATKIVTSETDQIEITDNAIDTREDWTEITDEAKYIPVDWTKIPLSETQKLVEGDGTTKTPTTLPKQESITDRIDHIYTMASDSDDSFGADNVLSDESFKAFKSEVKMHPSTVGIAVIANGEVDTDIVNITRGETALAAIDSSKFIFRRYMHEWMGAFLNTYAQRSQPNLFMHGTNTDKNYGDYYPMYYVDQVFANVGVSSYKLGGQEILELSFDKA